VTVAKQGTVVPPSYVASRAASASRGRGASSLECHGEQEFGAEGEVEGVPEGQVEVRSPPVEGRVFGRVSGARGLVLQSRPSGAAPVDDADGAATLGDENVAGPGVSVHQGVAAEGPFGSCAGCRFERRRIHSDGAGSVFWPPHLEVRPTSAGVPERRLGPEKEHGEAFGVLLHRGGRGRGHGVLRGVAVRSHADGGAHSRAWLVDLLYMAVRSRSQMLDSWPT